MANGNPSEIEWHVASGSVDIGTDGKFFGRFIAPVSRVRLATRSHVVGGIEARHFQMEPQSTVSMEPRAEEISHSRHNFGPFWNKNLFRYRSALPASISAIEMHVYAQGYDIRIDGSEDRNVNLEKISQKVSVKITRPFIADFPPEAFSSVYEYSFSKTSNNRIYWNPHSPCVSNCYGNSEESALRSFPQALADAQKDGLEVKMTGGVWEAGKEHSVFPVGLRLTGIEKPFWELSSFSEIPSINVKNYPIEIAGKSPRSLAGLHITGGTNGGLRASTERLELANLAFTQNESNGDGGALHYGGKGLLAGNVLLFENGRGNRGGGAFIDGDAEIENLVCSGNSSELEGGCLSVQGSLRLSNAVFHRNRSKQQGGAFRARNAAVLNATAVGNESNGNAFSGAAGSVFNSIFWQNAGGLDIPGSWAAQHSSFPSSRAGTGNIRGNPAFVNEGNAAGSARFFGYDAGLVLADKSPALKGNKDVVGTLDADLLGAEWGNAVAMGAYGDYNSDDNEFQYMTWDHGNLKKAVPARPLFPSFADQNIEDYISYGRIIMRLVKKHDKTKISKARVRITLLDSTAKAYPDAKPIEISFHRFKESDGKYREVDKKYVFSTLIHSIRPGYNAEEHGRVILFSRDPNDQGIYDKVIIIHAKEISDRFRYEVIR
jgi:predicted outer membrane repeat protein